MKNTLIFCLAVVAAVQLAILVNNDQIMERQRDQLNRCTNTMQQLIDRVNDAEAMEVFLRTNLDQEKANAVQLRSAIEELNRRLGYTPAPKKVVAKTMVDQSAEAILKKDGPTAAREFRDAVEENIRPALQEELAPIVAAIRLSEDGAPGLEYGVVGSDVRADMARRNATYRPQAGWCASTVQKNWDRWKKAGSSGDFITFLGNKYAPKDADNDPEKLNKNWIPNVTKITAKIRG